MGIAKKSFKLRNLKVSEGKSYMHDTEIITINAVHERKDNKECWMQ